METLSISSNSLSSNKVMPESNNSEWTNEQNTWFESALAIFDTETPDRWSNVAAMVPGKSEIDVKKQYEKLKADINEIEAGYLTSSSSFKLESDEDHDDQDFGIFRKRPTKFRPFDHERRKGVPWTEEEHRRFLMGLQVHGKGDWRSISRNFVMTKTPTQVASHAQKYYARQHADGKEKRRPSIHDITVVNLPHNTSSPERSSSSICTGNAMNYPFELAKMNKSGGNGVNNIRVFNSGLHFQLPTTYQIHS
ncbi:putative transcription factor MYB/SANT family [Helianthus anomalus]